MNAVEVFAPFAAIVLLAHVAGKANATTAFLVRTLFLDSISARCGIFNRAPVRKNPGIYCGVCRDCRFIFGSHPLADTRRPISLLLSGRVGASAWGR